MGVRVPLYPLTPGAALSARPGHHTQHIDLMNVTITDVTDVDKEVEISTTPEELDPHFEEAYRKYRESAELKGFRKGKAPLSMIRQIYGESIRYSAIDTIANDLYRRAMEERSIRPIGDPVLTTIDYKPETGLNFRIRYEVLPEFTLGTYTGVKVERPVHEITDAELQDEMDRIRRSNSTLAEASKIENEQTLVTADIQELDEGGTPLIGRRTADAKLYLADDSIFREIREKLIGAEAGSSVRMTVEPRDGEQGEKRALEVTVKQIKSVTLPEVTDDFVKKITKDKTPTAGAFRQELRESIRRYWDDRSRRRTLDAIIADIVGRHDFIVPESLVRAYTDSLIEDARHRAPDHKLPADFNEEEFREQNRGPVAFQAKWHLIRDRIIADAGLDLSPEDYERFAERDAAVIGVPKERLVEMYRNSASTRERLLTDKLNDYLLASAEVTEKTTTEFF
jgi:trigger factor